MKITDEGIVVLNSLCAKFQWAVLREEKVI